MRYKMKENSPKDFTKNPFKMIGDDWLLITAEKDGKTNAMTASWGGVGVIWNKNVAYCFIRDSRYTKEFVDNGETYSLCVFDHEANKEMLGYMGTVSGRTEDKVEKCKLTVEKSENTPYFAEAKTVLICKKLYKVEMPLENLEDSVKEEIVNRFYPKGDIHTMYVGEIVKILEK